MRIVYSMHHYHTNTLLIKEKTVKHFIGFTFYR